MNRYFWIAQMMIGTGVALRFGLALLPLAGLLEALGWFRPAGGCRPAAAYLRRLALLGLAAAAAAVGVVRYGFGYQVYFVDYALWMALGSLAAAAAVHALAGRLADRWPARLAQLALLAAVGYAILAVPYLRGQSRGLGWLFFAGPSLFVAYLPLLVRALAHPQGPARLAARALWWLLAPAVATFHAVYHFGLGLLATFTEGADFYPIATVYRGMMPLFFAAFLFTIWIQFWLLERPQSRLAWLGVAGGYAGAVLAAAMLWFGVAIFDTLAL